MTGEDDNLELCDSCLVNMLEMGGTVPKEKVDMIRTITAKCKEVKNTDR